MSYPRDLIGYGRRPPDPRWPGQARLALQIVLNYEEGGERAILHGDAESEAFLQEVVGMSPLPGVRNLQVESIYEYGSRVGFWRLLRLFAERDIKISVFAVAMALERHPDAARAIVEADHEVVSHGWRWIDYQFVDEDVEREHMRLAVESLTRVTGSRPSAGTRGASVPIRGASWWSTAGSSTTPTPTTTTCRTGSWSTTSRTWWSRTRSTTTT